MRPFVCAGLLLCGTMVGATVEAQSAPAGPDTTARWGIEAGLGGDVPVGSLLRFFGSRRALVVGLSSVWQRESRSEGERSTRVFAADVRTGLRLLGAPARVRPTAEVGALLGRRSFRFNGDEERGGQWLFGGYLRGGLQAHATPRIAALLAMELQFQRSNSDRRQPITDGNGQTVRLVDTSVNRVLFAAPVVGVTLLF
jgi:hypothetical protein